MCDNTSYGNSSAERVSRPINKRNTKKTFLLSWTLLRLCAKKAERTQLQNARGLVFTQRMLLATVNPMSFFGL